MIKMLGVLSFAVLTSVTAQASCDYTPNKDEFAFSFTAYGAKDKSYAVTNNTFTKYELSSDSGKLLNAAIDIDATSLDTSSDLNNGQGGLWPESMASVRNNNVVTGLFNNFVNPGKVMAKIGAIDASVVGLDVTMNGETNRVPMSYSVADGVLSAEGTLDILDYNGADAFKQFSRICRAWHKGKSWSDIVIKFSVPVTESGC